MRKIAYVKYRLNIDGLYFWGKGWKSVDVANRWDKMCSDLKTDPQGIICFTQSALVPGRSGVSPQFFSDKFSAYMHPMEIVGYLRSSDYVPGDEVKAVPDLKHYMGELLKVIRKTFPEITISSYLDAQSYIINLDEPTVKVHESMD